MVAFRRWLEAQFGVAPVQPGEDTNWSLRYNLGWPDWFVAVFLVLALLLIVTLYWREPGIKSRWTRLFLMFLRTAAVIMLLVMLGGLEIAIERTGLPTLGVLVDDSESMATQDRIEGSSADAEPIGRFKRVTDFLSKDNADSLAKLLDRYKLRLYTNSTASKFLGSATNRKELDELMEKLRGTQPTGSESRIGDSLRETINSMRGSPPAALLCFTDGVVTSGESLSQVASFIERKDVPVYMIGVGDPSPERDIALEDLQVDDNVFIDDTVTFEAKARGIGLGGESIKLRLRNKLISAGKPSETTPTNDAQFNEVLSDKTTPLDEQSLTLAPGNGQTSFRLTHRPTKAGEYLYQIDTPVLDRELSKDNNRLSRRIRVLDEKIKVLFVDNSPRYEYRFLKQLLERESTVELKTLELDSDPDHVKQDRSAIGSFPATAKQLQEFDVLILGDVSPAVFSPSQLVDIKQFVQTKGGGLIVIAGKQMLPIALRDSLIGEMLPVEFGRNASRSNVSVTTTGFIPSLTPDAMSAPMFRFAENDAASANLWRALPPVYWFAMPDAAKPAAVVFAEVPKAFALGESRPLIASHFYGAGRVFYQGFDGTWRWRQEFEDLYHGRYWIQTIRYMARSKLLGNGRFGEVTVDRRQYQRGEPVQVRFRLLDESLLPAGVPVKINIDHAKAGSKSVELKPVTGKRGLFEAIANVSVDGLYQVRVVSPAGKGSSPRTEFSVVPPPGELDQVHLEESELKGLAERTRGKYFHISAVDQLFSGLPKGTSVPINTDPPLPLWNTWPMLLVFASLLAVEWVIRKRCHLL